MNQKQLFNNDLPARRNDPETSKAAARDLDESGALGRMRHMALLLIIEQPGLIGEEYDNLYHERHGGLQLRPVSKRLAELARSGLIISQGAKRSPRTGRSCLQWFPTRDGIVWEDKPCV